MYGSKNTMLTVLLRMTLSIKQQKKLGILWLIVILLVIFSVIIWRRNSKKIIGFLLFKNEKDSSLLLFCSYFNVKQQSFLSLDVDRTGLGNRD